MTSTDAAEDGDTFSPAGDFMMQIDSAVAVVVDVEARVDATAAWAGIASIRSDSQPIASFVKLPFVRYRMRGNQAGNTVKIWDNG
jgi:predicted hotdog family 3-hydroxylacyl-ACP dehydratase